MWCTFVDKVSDLFLGQVSSTKGNHGYIVACLDAFMYTEGCFVKCLKEYCVCVVVGVPLIFLCVLRRRVIRSTVSTSFCGQEGDMWMKISVVLVVDVVFFRLPFQKALVLI